MKKIIVLFALLVPVGACSQSYLREAGFRGGITAGITYRQYLDDQLSYEGLLSFRQAGIQFTILRQVHEVTLSEYAEDFYLLYGFGGHAGYYFTDRYRTPFYNEIYYPYRRFSPLAGVDGYAALEYRFESIPISLAIDYKPFFEFSIYQFFRIQIWDFAFAFKYRF